ncbi:hypothetical protein ICK_06418 [Bacillus cereus BAG1X2-2]|nr:hypothetical protein ICK_06418 [Bacillus cereus BAG1X2-2]EOP00440.1 hypothetical protein ICO_06396 [Bacillus cereus BAG2O-1]
MTVLIFLKNIALAFGLKGVFKLAIKMNKKRGGFL